MMGLSALTSLDVREGEVALWWLGQASVALKGFAACVLIDPFLSDRPERRFPSPVDATETAGTDLVLITHEHWDHLDPETLSSVSHASPGASFVAPEPVADRVTACVPSDRVQPARPGKPLSFPGITVHPVRARHGITPADAYTFGEELSEGKVRYLGYVVDIDGVRVYHAGDTIGYPGMGEEVSRVGPDIALLPINGRDQEREAEGIVGNLGPAEAAALADGIGAEILVPIHYDMFANNLGHPEAVLHTLQERHPRIALVLPSRHQPIVLAARPRSRGHND